MQNPWSHIYGYVLGSDRADNLGGGQEGNYIKGNGGDDHLYSGWGNDILIPGPGRDTLVFGQFGDNPSTDGIDLVLGYEPDVDSFDLTAIAGLDDFFDVTMTWLHHGRGPGIVIDYGAGIIVLAGADTLVTGDFLL